MYSFMQHIFHFFIIFPTIYLIRNDIVTYAPITCGNPLLLLSQELPTLFFSHTAISYYFINE